MGIDYCILETSNWQAERDLGSVRVLFLPNVANLNGLQAEALEKWMARGGRAIVTGPTGNLSEPEVREQLRSLFGAYWGFANSSSATLRPVAGESPWGNRDELASTFFGGVVIPTGIDSKTAAVWLSDGKPPAVVINEKTTFLGWRWGEDEVAPAALDTAWLQASLNRFGIRPSPPLSAFAGGSARPCNPSGSEVDRTAPILPNWSEGSQLPLSPSSQPPVTPSPSPPLGEERSLGEPKILVPTAARGNSPPLLANRPGFGFDLPSSPASNVLSSAQVADMQQELENLLARFESTLLAAEAKNSRLPSPASRTNRQGQKVNTSRQPPSNRAAYQAALEARAGLQQFRQLVAQQEYEQARQLWLKTRRSLWDNYPTDRQFAQPEIRAIWLDRGTIVKAKSEQDLAVIFDRLAAAGINTVFFETINASYPIYPSRIAPEQNPLTRGWDPLKAAVKLAHQRGMELHAWTWLFAAANQGHNTVLNQPANYLGPVLSRNPDWGITDRQGNPFDRGVQYRKAFFDPANPAVQRYLLALLEEIATNYDVDGIQFDYVRYPFQDPKIDQTFGYSQSSRWLFKEMTGVDPMAISLGHPLWEQWVGFRIQQVDSFVATASARLKSKRPDLLLSAAVFPLQRRDRLFRLQQNWEEWMRQGWVDLIVLMTYALDTGSLEERTQPLFDQSLPGSSLVLPGLRLLKVPDPVTVDQLQYVRNMPTGGYALFAAENLTSAFESILNRTQGANDSANSEPLPHRQPFQAAAARYQALQREWSFLFANKQLAVEGSNLKAWAQQVDVLGKALAQLASQPSQRHLTAAQTALAKFRRQFPQWMRRQAAVQPYQVQVWQNRLLTLDHLLSYGERVTLRERRF
jgi:uncharacterized lipoprotein YddW (UPF0748 family)